VGSLPPVASFSALLPTHDPASRGPSDVRHSRPRPRSSFQGSPAIAAPIAATVLSRKGFHRFQSRVFFQALVSGLLVRPQGRFEVAHLFMDVCKTPDRRPRRVASQPPSSVRLGKVSIASVRALGSVRRPVRPPRLGSSPTSNGVLPPRPCLHRTAGNLRDGLARDAPALTGRRRTALVVLRKVATRWQRMFPLRIHPGPCTAPAQVSPSSPSPDQGLPVRVESCSRSPCGCSPLLGSAHARRPLLLRSLPDRRLSGSSRFRPPCARVAWSSSRMALSGREDLAPCRPRGCLEPCPGVPQCPVRRRPAWDKAVVSGLPSVDFACLSPLPRV
jgi:hypothetical protein